MRSTVLRWLVSFWVVMTLGCAAVSAHELPINSIMNAFVRTGSTTADLVVRVPMDLLRGIPFPVKDGHYVVEASSAATELAVVLLEDGFALYENDGRLTASSSAARLSPPGDRSFESYEAGVATSDKPSASGMPIPYDKGSLDVHFAYPITSPDSVFKIQTHVAADLGSGAKLTVRYLPRNADSRAMIIDSGAEPAALNPAWHHAAGGFTMLGIEHILTGFDHLLFLFCLVIPFRRVRGLISVITAFTLAHSITLFASAFHLAPQGAWFPPFVEMAIAASIVYTAVENIVGADLRHRWMVAGGFGLVHGFGFSNALGQSLQFAGSHLLLSLFSFNIGIEIGQLAVLTLILPALALLRRAMAERTGIVLLSAVVTVIGAYWFVERWQVLRQLNGLDSDAQRAINTGQWLVLLALIAWAVMITMRRIGRSRRVAAGRIGGDADRTP